MDLGSQSYKIIQEALTRLDRDRQRLRQAEKVRGRVARREEDPDPTALE